MSSKVDQSFVKCLLSDLVSAASPTGYEAEASDVLREALSSIGMQVTQQLVSPESKNTIGRFPGNGNGPDLMFVGHLDTSYGGDEEWLNGQGFKAESVEYNGHLVGLGSWNMKNGLAAAAGAAKYFLDRGAELPGDILLAGVVGEIETISVGDYQGPRYEGYGVGARHLTSHGVSADAVIVAEPTDFRIGVARMGAIWLRVDIRGDFVHAARSYSDGTVLAVEEAQHALKAIQKWGYEYSQQSTYMGTTPTVTIGCVEAGKPWRVSRTPRVASIYLDIRFPPGVRAIDVQRQVESELANLSRERSSFEFSVESYMISDATEVSSESTIVNAATNAYASLHGEPPSLYCRDVMDDTGHFNSLGIPTISLGVDRPDESVSTKFGGESVRLQSVYRLSELFVETAERFMDQ